MSIHMKPGFSRVAIIGSGFGGLGMGYYLKQAGIPFTIFEKAGEIGGTWRENTYPGAACDVPSHFYSFSFERRYPWSWRYGKQREIFAYQKHCAHKYGLYPHIRFNTEVTGASFDERRGLWVLQLANGERHEAQAVVSAVGQLHRPAYPKIPGLERFQGKAFHSAHWDHDYALAGKRVAVIGTGASAIQFVPEIAKQVQQLHVYQRSPGWLIPKVEKALSPLARAAFEKVPFITELDRLRIYGFLETVNYAYDGHAWAEKVLRKVCEATLKLQVKDPDLRRKLTPDFPVGCKRILLSTDWYPTLQRRNVELVTDAIAEITETGVRTADGRLREVDALIYGTGFAATEFLETITVRGLQGRELHQAWKHGAEAYLGMTVSGFPNFFMLYGPNTNVGSGSIIFMLEQQQRYITALLTRQEAEGWTYADLKPEAQRAYNEEIQLRSSQTTYAGNCQSWYKTAEGRNTNNWVGSMTEYARRTREPVIAHYRLVKAEDLPRAVPATAAAA